MAQEKDYNAMIEEAAAFIAARSKVPPVLGAVLGSGLGASDFAEGVDTVELLYREIPHMPAPTVAGHAGRLVLGSLGGKRCAILSGRVHLYEGWDGRMVTFAVRVLARLGCRAVFLTNAAGAVSPALRPGSLVLITDHINLTREDPTRGPLVRPSLERFTGMVDAYDPGCRDLVRRAADGEGILLKEGVYASLAGPSYETPAEIRMLAALGADLLKLFRRFAQSFE